MKLKIRTLENFILLLIIGQVVVFRFFNVYETMNKVILALISILLLLNLMHSRKASVNKDNAAVNIFIIVVFLFLNGVLFGIGNTFRSNILTMLYPAMNMFYLTYYIKKHQDSFYRKMIQLKYVINIYFVVNIVVMFIQLQGNYFLVGVVTQENTMYQDLISGLLGYNMVAAVCYFSVFVITYNVVISRTIKSRFNRKIFTVYNVLLIIVVAYLSTQNDNIQYFAFVPLALIIIMLSRNKLNTITGVQKVILVILSCVFVVTAALALIPGLYDVLNDSVFYKFTGAIEHIYDGASVTHGSMERLALVVYGLSHAGGWLFGTGFSYAHVYTPYTFGFVHFGNANIGAIICLGGIWFYFAMIFLYSKKITYTIQFNVNKDQNVFYGVMVSLFLIAASTFSIPLTDVSIGLCVMFIMIVFGLNKYLDAQKEGIK